eukprot:3935356-Rhodomonas_salina.1
MTATVSSGLALITRKPDTITLEGARWYDLRSRHPNLDTFDSLRSHCNMTSDMERRGYRTLHWSFFHHAQLHLGITASIGDSAVTAFPNFAKGFCVADGYRWGPSLTSVDRCLVSLDGVTGDVNRLHTLRSAMDECSGWVAITVRPKQLHSDV